MKLPNKTCQRTKEKSIKILSNVQLKLKTIKNVLPMKDIEIFILLNMANLLLIMKDMLKTLPSSGISNYIKIQQRQRFRKTAVKELGKM